MVIEKELLVKVHLGESFVSLNEYFSLDVDESKIESKQLHLKLTKPNEGR